MSSLYCNCIHTKIDNLEKLFRDYVGGNAEIITKNYDVKFSMNYDINCVFNPSNTMVTIMYALNILLRYRKNPGSRHIEFI